MIGISHIDFWDVGQADSSVIHLTDGSYILIDVGTRKSPVVGWLTSFASAHVRVALITHNDGDHIGGLTSLVSSKTVEIDEVLYVPFRDSNSAKVENLYAALSRIRDRLRPAIEGDIAWNSGLWSISILQPNTLDAWGGIGGINRCSAIYELNYNGVPWVIWPGDTAVSNLKEKLGSKKPYLIVGPHHGNPPDSKEPDFGKNVTAISQERSFLSLGSRRAQQGKKLPRPNSYFVKQLTKKGCKVTCSQLTSNCSETAFDEWDCILDGTQILGLHGSSKGFSCRGTLRLHWDATGELFRPDRNEVVHRQRIAERLPQALCR